MAAKNQPQIAEELRTYLLTKVRTQRELADKIGVSQTHLSNYLRGSERISRKVADRIVELWPEIREAFILTGDGELLYGHVQHLENVKNSGSIVNVAADSNLRAEVVELRAALERERTEKERLLGIIETLTTK